MIDSHAHLDFKQFDKDRKSVLQRFFDDNGKSIINIGVDQKRNEKSLEIAQKNEKIFTSLGFHPESEGVDLKKVEKYLRKKAQNPKVVAIGEIGLDYFHTPNHSVQGAAVNKEKIGFQKKLFVKQLEVAKELDLPVVIHCRDAYKDVLRIISDKKFQEIKMVMHCFCGGLQELEDFLKFPNLLVSFTGNVTFVKKGNDFLEVIKKTPIDRMMVETDCPFLAPVPYRGKRNEPVFVKFVIEKIAGVKEVSSGKIEKKTDDNAIKFFNLKI